LNELLPYQRADFEGLFNAMNGLPVIIRLIDPPLHEFLPSEEALLEEVITMRVKGETKGLEAKEKLLASVRGLHESNPMMGLRGVRLSIEMPEIVEMQVRAIFEAAANQALAGVVVKPEVMIPLTGTVKELEWIENCHGGDGREEGFLRIQVWHDDRDPSRCRYRRRDRRTG